MLAAALKSATKLTKAELIAENERLRTLLHHANAAPKADRPKRTAAALAVAEACANRLDDVAQALKEHLEYQASAEERFKEIEDALCDLKLLDSDDKNYEQDKKALEEKIQKLFDDKLDLPKGADEDDLRVLDEALNEYHLVRYGEPSSC